MVRSLSKNSIRELVDLSKATIYIENGYIGWKRLEKRTKLPEAFNTLSVKNKNRVAYYGAAIHKIFQSCKSFQDIMNMIDMDEHYDTSTKENFIILVSKLMHGDNFAFNPALLFSNLIEDVTKEELIKEFSKVLDLRAGQLKATQSQYRNYFFLYSFILLINTLYDGSYYPYIILNGDEPESLDSYIRTLFNGADLPEPTIDYIDGGK